MSSSGGGNDEFSPRVHQLATGAGKRATTCRVGHRPSRDMKEEDKSMCDSSPSRCIALFAQTMNSILFWEMSCEEYLFRHASLYLCFTLVLHVAPLASDGGGS